MAEDYKEVRVTLDLNVSGDTVSQNDTSNNVPTAPNEPNGETTSNKKLTEKQKGNNQAMALALAYSKKVAMSAVSNYGAISGDYVTARKLQTITNIGMTVAAIAVNPVIGGISAVYQLGSTMYNQVAEIKRNDRIASFNAERVAFSTKRS